MPLTLEKYAEQLDKRGEPHPDGPTPDPIRAKPHLPVLDVKAMIFGGYGTLLLIQGGEPQLLNPDPLMRKIALDKTIREFKMWASMSRKPGEPSAYMEEILGQVRDKLLASGAGAKTGGGLPIEVVWLGVIQRLKQKDYVYEEGLYGDPTAFSQKLTYFYLRSSQGVSVFPNELTTLKALAKRKLVMGIHANGPSCLPVQLWDPLESTCRHASLSIL